MGKLVEWCIHQLATEFGNSGGPDVGRIAAHGVRKIREQGKMSRVDRVLHLFDTGGRLAAKEREYLLCEMGIVREGQEVLQDYFG